MLVFNFEVVVGFKEVLISDVVVVVFLGFLVVVVVSIKVLVEDLDVVEVVLVVNAVVVIKSGGPVVDLVGPLPHPQ